MGLRDRIAALLGVSTFAPPVSAQTGLSVDDPTVEHVRKAHGGQLSPMPQSRIRWYMKDLETAERLADNGDLSLAAQLMRACRKDGNYAGILSTRTGGLVRLPKRFRGNKDIIAELEAGHDNARSVFDELCPPSELALLAADGFELGVGVAKIEAVEGRPSHGIMIRLDPEFLSYRWDVNQWQYMTIAGPVNVVPGDGTWVLHIPGGRVSPWHTGMWRAVGRAYIRKDHAAFYRDNWLAKLANAARVATAPQGAAQEQKDGWFQAVAAWGVNTVFGITPGYDVQLLESNGRGHESFQQTIDDQNNETVMAVAGQTVTTDGGAGFANADIHKSIRADLIKETADGLAHTVNTQILPSYVVDNYGEDQLDDMATMSWDVEPAKDRNAEATALVTASNAMKLLTEALATHSLKLDAEALTVQFGIPVDTVIEDDDQDEAVAEATLSQALNLATQKGMQPSMASVISINRRAGVALEKIKPGTEQPLSIELAPTDVAKVVKAGEARRANGLPLFGDERDELTISQMGETAKAEGETEVVEAKEEAEDTATPGVTE